MSKVRSITEAQRQPATYADVLAVINTASSMIAALEARIEALEKAARADEPGTHMTLEVGCFAPGQQAPVVQR